MDAPGPLPDGLTARPLTLDDVDATIAMVNACELADSGELMWERADLLADSSIDGFDRSKDWIGVFDGGAVVGWGLTAHPRGVWIDVTPNMRGRGIGTWLRLWSIERAREKGADRIGQTIDDDRTEVAAMFATAGYTPRRRSWILRMTHPTRPEDPTPPDGVVLRAYRDSDADQLLTMFEEAFSEFDDRPTSFPIASWRAGTIEREGFVPDDMVMAIEGNRIVGGAFLVDAGDIWVDKIATHRDVRNRGIARALLQTAFQRSFDRGYDHTSLSTDSNTGALTLYERIGMTVHRSFTHYALDL